MLSVAPVSVKIYVKEKAELLFWQGHLARSKGNFYNGHMEANFTTLFGLTPADYTGKRVLDIVRPGGDAGMVFGRAGTRGRGSFGASLWKDEQGPPCDAVCRGGKRTTAL